MPVVINELVFKGEITAPTSDRRASDRADGSARAVDARAIIEESVERVARLLEREKER